MSKHTHVMVDLETLGLKPGARILEIGAVGFNIGEETRTYSVMRINPEYYTFSGFDYPDPSTIAWWDTQGQETKAMVFSGTAHPAEALEAFSEFLKEYCAPDCKLWGNAASFDLKLLERAYEICNLPVPWNYKQEACYRTLKNLFPSVTYIPPATKHMALEDAFAQANHAKEILELIAARGF